MDMPDPSDRQCDYDLFVGDLQDELENTKKLLEFEKSERMYIFSATLKTMTNGEWDEMKIRYPDLHAFVKQAVNR